MSCVSFYHWFRVSKAIFASGSALIRRGVARLACSSPSRRGLVPRSAEGPAGLAPSLRGLALACPPIMAERRLGPRSLAWRTVAERAAVAPGRGRWLALLRVADVEAVARASLRTLGQRCPSGLPRAIERGIAMLPGPAGPFNVDDLSVVLAAVGVTAEAQEFSCAAEREGLVSCRRFIFVCALWFGVSRRCLGLGMPAPRGLVSWPGRGGEVVRLA
jgi:hypothetical protein